MATTLIEGAEIINDSLKALGYDYQIDLTDDITITEGLEAIGAYAPSQKNAIMEQMNLILQQRNFGVMFDATKNKFRAFLIDMSENGFGVEDVFHEIIAGRAPFWDNNETAENIAKDLVSYETKEIEKVFHTEKMERQFKGTVDRRNYEKVFTAYGVTRYIDVTLANLSWSAEIWLMTQIINIAKTMVADGKIKFIDGGTLNTENGVRNVVEDIKASVDGFLTPSNQFNIGAYDINSNSYTPVVNISNSKDDIFIITTPEYMNRLKVQGYANAFNLSEFELEGRIIFAPSGTNFGTYNGKDVSFIIVDKRALVAGIRRWYGTSFFVPNTGITNHWLTVEGIKGYNTVFNAVAITTETIDSIEETNKSDNIFVQTISLNGAEDYLDLYADGELLSFNSGKVSSQNGAITRTVDKYIPTGTELSVVVKSGTTLNTQVYCDGEIISTYNQNGTYTVKCYPNHSFKVISVA